MAGSQEEPVADAPTSSGTDRTSSWIVATVATARTVPTRIWLGRRTASRTSEMRLAFSVATVIEMI